MKGLLERQFIKTRKLKPSDELHIHCKLRYEKKKTIVTGHEPEIYVPTAGNLVSRFETLFKEGLPFSDVVIDVDGTKFSAHKIVLAAGSPVFSTMFQSHGFTESETNIIKIDDLEPPVVYEMLRFLYTDRVKQFDLLACGLLFAAEKYMIELLKTKCQAVLAESLTIENCSELLSLADSNSAEELKKVAMEFILQHSGQVMQTDGWKEIIQTHPQIGFQLFGALTARTRPTESEDTDPPIAATEPDRNPFTSQRSVPCRQLLMNPHVVLPRIPSNLAAP